MMYLQKQGWKILSQCEKLAGYWPYQSQNKNYAIRIGISLLLLTYCFPLITRMVKEWNSNFYIILENSFVLAIILAVNMKILSASLFQPQRQKILESIALHYETIVDQKEIDILDNYSRKGLKFTIAFTVATIVCCAIYDGLPMLRMYFHYFLGEGTLEKKCPLHVDYLVDEQEYFYYILVHLSIDLVVGMIAEFTYEMTFFLSVRHTCALFEVVKLRLKKALEIFEQCDGGNKIIDSDEEEAFNIISSAVALHIEAIQLARSVDQAYNVCWFIILLMNMMILAPIIVTMLFYLNNLFELCRYTVGLIMFLLHFYVIFEQGQLINDHSSSVFTACYDSNWYITPKRIKMSIAMVMVNSLTPCQLTGGNMFVLSMETYGKMLKKGLSFVSIVAAFED